MKKPIRYEQNSNPPSAKEGKKALRLPITRSTKPFTLVMDKSGIVYRIWK
tara:strand:+ start:818 stop:967 length:150 start_codon:yes stop_codon:yes gene_type:complete